MIMKHGSLSDLSFGAAPIAGRNLLKTVLVSLFLCIEKPEKFVGLKLSRKLTT